MRRTFLFSALALGLTPFVSLQAADEAKREVAEPKPPIEVKIAIPLHHNHRSLNEYAGFNVLVTNTSNQPVRLWTEKYSWGYDNLQFELVDDDGKVTKVTKAPRDWDKNFPDWLELAPGDSYVLKVDFFSVEGKASWQNAPTKKGNGGKPELVKLRAVYAIGSDQYSKEHNVWTGRIVSPVGTYAIW